MSGAAPIGDGIFQIPVPITNNPLGHTLVYAMESPKGLVLVDAGWDDDNAWDGLTTGLNEIGYSVQDVEGVVLTHFHPDHVGLCGRVREASGAWIAMHEDDFSQFEEMTAVRDEEFWRFHRQNLINAGAGNSDVAAYELVDAPQAPTTTASKPDRILSGEQRITLTGRELRAVHTPGHTPGHVCFYLEAADVMFTGDHVLQKTTPHVGAFTYPLEERDGLAEFLDSLRLVQKMGVTRGLGAHGIPIDDIPARATELIGHHEDRLEHLYNAFGDDELTVWQVAERMKWYKQWNEISPLGKHMALAEAAAHLRHLVTRNQVVQVLDRDPAVFVRVPGSH